MICIDGIFLLMAELRSVKDMNNKPWGDLVWIYVANFHFYCATIVYEVDIDKVGAEKVGKV